MSVGEILTKGTPEPIPQPETSFADYHVHTPYCGHAKGAIVDYIETALREGLHEIGFSDHLGRYYLSSSQKRRHWDWGMDENLLSRYVNEINTLRETYRDRIAIKLGLEIDYIEGAEGILEPIIEKYDFDYLLGSIHCVPALGWKHLAIQPQHNAWEIFRRYFALAEAAVNSGLFDILAHTDFIWRYIRWPRDKSRPIFEAIESLVARASQKGITLEINANGYLWSQIFEVPGGDPFLALLHAIQRYNVPITLGSDAHKPEFVAKSFRSIQETLHAAGITRCALYDKRRRRMARLAP